MRNRFYIIVCIAITTLAIISCRITAGAGGSDTGTGVRTQTWSDNSYDLVPTGDRITYTIDISTPEGRRKLYKLSMNEAKRLAETEASRKYNCDRLIDPRFDFLKKGKRILRITVDGRPGVYRLPASTPSFYNDKSPINININQ